jgi:hypothetical protein
MTLWDRIKSWKTQNAQQLVYVRIPADRTDVPRGKPIAANRGYLRLWLSDMFLSQSRAWFTEWHPCVETAVQLDLGGKKGATVTHVASPPRAALSPGVFVGYPVTDLLPFAGGVVEIEAALLALKGESYLAAALGILESFSGLVTGPVSEALGVAEKVATGLDKLVGATDGQVHLGLHDAFGSAGGPSALAPGYLAVVRATPQQLDGSRLGVASKRLFVQTDAAWVPLQGHDYMLYYVEGREERDDWRLPAIQGPLDQALEAIVLGDGPKAGAYKKAALIAALTCKELTPLDRQRVARAVKDELAAAADAGQGAAGPGSRDLDAIVKTHASMARGLGDDLLTEDEILS